MPSNKYCGKNTLQIVASNDEIKLQNKLALVYLDAYILYLPTNIECDARRRCKICRNQGVHS